MRSQMHGEHISNPEVTNVSTHGLWLLSGEEELFLSYEDFPWFKGVALGKILHVEEQIPGHFSWPELDVDLGLDTIKYPERFPLKAK